MFKKGSVKLSNPLVSIVVLNWNGTKDTVRCLESIAGLAYKNYEVILVDNGSKNPIQKKDITYKGRIKTVYNNQNLGFAGGQISALPHCNGEFIFLLNNDATIHKNSISEALKTFKIDDDIAVVGGRSYSVDEDFNELNSYYSYQHVDAVTAETRTYGHDDSIQDSVTVSGSAVMIRRSVIDSFGYFDKRFFAYYEETDLFARYLRAGKRIIYNPKVITWHKDGASTKNKRTMYYYLMLKNQFLFAFKNFDSDALYQFVNVYFRNFRRSLWVYARNRSKTEAVHKARVYSTLWNIVNIFLTIAARKKTLDINRDFSYTKTLLEKQPIPVSITIDARNKINSKSLFDALVGLISLPSHPAEIIVVTSKSVKLPDTAHDTTIRNIVDTGKNKLTAFDFGFMSSNTELLFFTTYNKILSFDNELSETLIKSYRLMTEHEGAIAVKNFSGNEFRVANGGKCEVVAIRKPDLVNFLDIHRDIYSINRKSWGHFINWLIVDCRPVVKIVSPSLPLVINIETPKSKHPTLTNTFRWKLKKILRRAHLSRAVASVKRYMIKKDGVDKIIDYAFSPKQLPFYTDEFKHNTPIFINTRDRFEPLIQLVSWLEKGKYNNIVFIDNDSTYPELLKFFKMTSHQVIKLGRNGMHKSPWESFAVRFIAKDNPYVVTDPDIIPTRETPPNTISHLYEILQKYPSYLKAGVALKIDDIPDYYSMKKSVIEWESRYWSDDIVLEKNLYRADLDTTLALYREKSWWSLSPSIRVAGKYSMRHEPWYQNLDDPTDDMLYYRVRASNEVSTWTKGKLPKHHIRALKKEGLI